MRSVLALDLSKTSTGFAFGRPDQTPQTGVVAFKGDCNAEVWANVATWMSNTLKVMQPDELAIEMKISSSGHDGFKTNAKTQDLLSGIQSMVRAFWWRRAYREPDLVPSASARLCFIGRGGNFGEGGPKPLVIAEGQRRGWLEPGPGLGDRADALAVWCFKASEQLPELAFNQSRRRA